MPTVNGLTVTLADRVQETTQTTGTGTYNLDGAATGKRTFVAGIGNGVRTLYAAALGANWEIGIGTVTSGAPATLSRDAILASTNSNNAVSWGAGTKDIFCDIAAALANQIWTRPGASFSIGALEVRAPQVPSGSVSVIDFTSIASTAQLIYINYTLIRSDNTRLFVQIGDSGGIEILGYNSTMHSVTDADVPGGAQSISAFLLSPNLSAGTTQHGIAMLSRISTSLWHITGTCSSISSTISSASSAAGSKALSTGPLDRVRIGANANFTAGGAVGVQIIHAV